MGESKRRKNAGSSAHADLESGFNAAEREYLSRLRRGAYRHARIWLARARSVSDEESAIEHVAEIHREATRVLDGSTESFFATARDGRSIQSRIACKKGCSFCCNVNVEVTIVEAIGVAAVAAKDSFLRAAVLATAPRIDGLGSYERLRARVPCPLLRDGMCSVYDARPRSCRAFTSFDVKRCEDEFLAPDVERPKVTTFTWPRVLATAATEGIRLACEEENLQATTVELTAGVATVLRVPGVVSLWLAGKQVFPARAVLASH